MSQRKASVKPCEIPGSASAEEGLVVLDGPDGVAVTMTAEAARLTAASLHHAAAEVTKAQNTPPASQGSTDAA